MGGVIDGYLVKDLNQDSEKTEKELREKELAAITDVLSHLFILTEISLSLAAPFTATKEIEGQIFSESATAAFTPKIYWDFRLIFRKNESVDNPILTSLAGREWSYRFEIIFNNSPIQTVKFSLHRKGSGNYTSEWAIFKDLYLKTQGEFYLPILEAIHSIRGKMEKFFQSKVPIIKEDIGGLLYGWQHLFGLNAAEISRLVIETRSNKESLAKCNSTLADHRRLISETCQALRDTKGFVKSKKLAEIRENLEKKSHEIMISVST